MPEGTFASLKKLILTSFKEYEPYLEQSSIREHLQSEVAHMLIFGTTFFDREHVGGSFRVAPSEDKFKAFCKEFMDLDEYNQLDGEVLDPPSMVDWMRALKPEAIVELFNRNGVWNHYTDAQIEEMLPGGVVMIDIIDARDGD